jgi:hypothetical protein
VPTTVQPYFLAVDPLSSDIYVHVFHASQNKVQRYTLGGTDAAPSLHFEGYVDSAGQRPPTYWRHLCTVPPAPRSRTSYLVVGTSKERELLILALPTCKRVHTFTLPERFMIRGLAADRAGSALIVADERGPVTVLPWPLPGMPPDTDI